MMKASDIMTKDVVTVRGSATVAEAVALMKDKGLRALIVQPRHDADPYGMVTETDIVYKVAAFGHDPKEMRERKIKRLPSVQRQPASVHSSESKPKPMYLEDQIEVAREDARRICKDQGDTSPGCAAAWDAVEELQAAASHQRIRQD